MAVRPPIMIMRSNVNRTASNLSATAKDSFLTSLFNEPDAAVKFVADADGVFLALLNASTGNFHKIYLSGTAASPYIAIGEEIT